MSVIAPPPSPRPRKSDDLEALIEEARRHARRRRLARAAAAILALGAGIALLASMRGGGGGGDANVAHHGQGQPALPKAGAVVGTLPFSPRETELFAARGGSLFLLVVPPSRAASITVERLDSDGTVARKRVPFDRANYLMDVSTGRDGIYAGTAVIKRFTGMQDELVRIDPRTLTIVARAFFPSSVAAVEQGGDVWASISDGRVVRLDPRTLATEASRQVLAVAVTARGTGLLSKPAFGLGSLWVLAGDASDLELVRLDPVTLAVLSKTRVPTRGDLHQALNRVVADSGHVYLVGSAITAVDATGKLMGRPVPVPGLATTETCGTGLVGLTGGNPSMVLPSLRDRKGRVLRPARPELVLLDAHGRVLARTGLIDAGARLAISGNDAWFVGDAGRGNGIIHVRLANH
ncbi:MAG TPA: hypothetical protein VK488_15300 [Gaiellaceae bacterium]|nr:hypothetical protein [Gaiellaceae bacterium]